MKKLIPFALALILGHANVFAQVKIGDNSNEISPQALLELESTTKGLVIPRMTTAQRDAAFDQSTPLGMVIFNIDQNKLQYFKQLYDANGKQTNLKVWEGATDEIVTTSEGGTPTVENPGPGDLFYNEEQNILYAYSTTTNNWMAVGNFSYGSVGQNLSASLSTNSLTIVISDGNTQTVDLSSIDTDDQDIDSMAFNSSTNILTVGITGGSAGAVDLSDLDNSGTDNQTLTLTGQVLAISSGNSVTLTGSNTDSQTLTASLNTNSITLAISGGNTQTVDLSSIDTDEQDIDGLAFNSSTNVLTVGITGGTSQTIDLSDLDDSGTDSQTLTLTGQVLAISSGNSVTLTGSNTDSQTLTASLITNSIIIAISGGNTQTVDLSSIDTDEQDIDSMAFNSSTNVLTVGITGGSADTVDLSDLDNSGTDSQTLTLTGQVLAISSGNSVTLTGSNTDSQTLTASLNTNSITLAISGGNTQTVDLSSIDTDDQDIDSMAFNSSTNVLTVGITGGSADTVDLSDLDNSGTDSQTLTLTGQVLAISSGNSVTLTGSNTDSQTLTASLNTNSITIAISGGNTQTVDLSSIDTDTDEQDIDSMAFNSSTNVLTVGITGGSADTVDLSDLDNSGTDSQTLTASLNTNSITIAISGGNTQTVDLSSIDTDTDEQDIDSMAFNSSTNVLTVGITGGSADTVDLSDLDNSGTDSQTLTASLNTNSITIAISGGNTQTVDLSSIDTDTDEQDIDSMAFNSSTNVLTVGITGGSADTVDLSDLDNSGTDSQTLTASLNTNSITIAISGGNTQTVDLSSIDTDTDEQDIDSMAFNSSTNVLTVGITGGSADTVDLSDLDNSGTDSQTLTASLNTNSITIAISGGNTQTVDLSSIDTDTDEQDIDSMAFNSSTNVLTVGITGGSADTVDLSDLDNSGTDSQTLTASLNTNSITIAISGGNTQTVDLSSIDTDTDEQDIDSMAFNSSTNVLTVGITGGSADTVDLSDLDNSGTDSQTLTASLNTNSITIAISDGNTQTVDLSSIDTDDQDIDSMAFNSSTNVLTVGITDGTSQTVDLSDLDNSGTDSQTLTASLNTNSITIAISDGNTQTVDLSSIDTDDQTLAEVTAQGSTTTDSIRVGGIFDNGTLVVMGESELQGDVKLGDASSDTVSFNGLVDTDILFETTAKHIASTSTPVTKIYSDELKPGTGNDLSINTNSTSERINFSNNDVITAGVNSSTLFVGDISGPNYYNFPSGAEKGTVGQVLTVSSTTNDLYFSDPETLPTASNEGATLRWNSTSSVWEASNDLRIAPGTGYSPSDALWIEESIIPSTTLDLGQSGNNFDEIFVDQLISSQNSVTFGTNNGSNKIYLKFEGDSNGSMVLNEKTAMDGNYNTVFGYRNFTLTGTTGNNNVAIGFEVLNNGSTGTGDDNVGVGYNALSYNTGSNNVAVGSQALENNTGGVQNVAIGSRALDANTQGEYNVAVGYNSLTENTLGEDNIAIGKQSMESNTIGDKNIVIGTNADVGANNLDNAIAIGYNATVNASNTIRLGNSDIESIISSGTLTLDSVTYPNEKGTAGQVLTASSTTNLLYFADASSLVSTPELSEVTAQGSSTTDVIKVGGLQDTSLGSQNEILVVGASDRVISTDVLSIDDVNKRVGIGTSSPQRALHMSSDTAFYSSILVDQYDTSRDGPDILLRKARGTESSPTANISDDELGKILFYTYDGSDFEMSSGIVGKSVVDSGNYGSKLDFFTTTDGDIDVQSDTPRLTLEANGDAVFSGDLQIPANLEHEGDTDTYLQFAGANDLRLISGGVDALKATGSELSINDGSADYDFRVESNDNVNMLFVDAGEDRIGIATNSPSATLHMVGEATSSSQIRLDQHNSDSDAPDIRLYKSRGTKSSPSAVANGDNLGFFNVHAYNGSSYPHVGAAGWTAHDSFANSEYVIETRVNSVTARRFYINDEGDLEYTGNIDVSKDVTADNFNTASDYRLKEDFKDFDALALVQLMQIYDYKWKSREARAFGVKAHELQAIIPYVVRGEKDGEETQKVDYSKLVPVLIKAIQEQQKNIETLKNRIEGYEILQEKIIQLEQAIMSAE